MGKLTANILKTSIIGKHSDGAGLYLLVTGHDDKSRAKGSWFFRYTYFRQRYEMGLGSIQSLSLARARSECDRWRDMMNNRRHSVNPMEEKRRLEINAKHGRAAMTMKLFGPGVIKATAKRPTMGAGVSFIGGR